MRNPAPALLLLLVAFMPVGWAQAASAYQDRGFIGLKPVSDARLDALRGGFTLSEGGVTVDLAIGVATYINDQLVSASDLTGAAVPSSMLRLIQNGPGNVFNPGASSLPGTFTTVIQNSLDQQVIRNVNLLNATVTSRAMAQALSLQSSVRSALTGLSH